MRDVAASAAGDEDLRAELPRAVDGDDARRWRRSTSVDGGKEPGGAGADDGEINLFGGGHRR
jgi:hypothetical protein